MIRETLEKLPLVEDAKQIEMIDNVVDFPSKLRSLRNHVKPDILANGHYRGGRRSVQTIDYLGWHAVADILDQTTPNWSHQIKNVKEIGKIITVIAAISIDGVTREGIGTGFAGSETGIQEAEHDALKRAAVKFGVARDLYQIESQADSLDSSAGNIETKDFPTDPIAKSLYDLVTSKQLRIIKSMSRLLGIIADDECRKLMYCKTNELSREAASILISHFEQVEHDRPLAVTRAKNFRPRDRELSLFA